jgi:hypothetical protein
MTAEQIYLDTRRKERIGMPEAVLCGAKTIAQIEEILRQSRDEQRLLTRLPKEHYIQLSKACRSKLDYDDESQTAFWGELPKLESNARVGIISAGTSDFPVAKECTRVLQFHGESSRQFIDVGVAGLWRLESCLDEIRDLPVLVVVAGMDAALVSVLGGLVGNTIIAVPTSVGYGVASGGESALNAILASCAPGVCTVNIDNGYGAACAALRILNNSSMQKVSP